MIAIAAKQTFESEAQTLMMNCQMALSYVSDPWYWMMAAVVPYTMVAVRKLERLGWIYSEGC